MPKNLKEGTLWDVLTFILSENEKLKGGHFRDIEKLSKKVSQSQGQKGGLKVPKKVERGTLLLRIACKKISAHKPLA